MHCETALLNYKVQLKIKTLPYLAVVI